MNWKYCFGFDDKENVGEIDFSVGCMYTIATFFIVPFTLLLLVIELPGLINEYREERSILYLLIWLCLFSAMFFGEVILVRFIGWFYSKFQFNAEGIQLRSFFRVRRTIKWSDIKKAAVYDVYWGRDRSGVSSILIFLNLDKRPIVLHGDHDGFYKRKFFVMIIATEENVKAFESFWGAPLEKGVQIREVYSLETHPFEGENITAEDMPN